MKHLFILLSLIGLLGCGEQRPAGMPPLYPATVTVTRGSEPLSGVFVALRAEEEALGIWSSSGITGQDGSIRFKTQGKYDGVPAGKYKVVLSLEEMEDAGKKFYYRVSLIDPKFNEESTTPAEFEVKKSGNMLSVDVGDAVKVRVSGKLAKSVDSAESK
jgi:hypothetical protein